MLLEQEEIRGPENGIKGEKTAMSMCVTVKQATGNNEIPALTGPAPSLLFIYNKANTMRPIILASPTPSRYLERLEVLDSTTKRTHTLNFTSLASMHAH